MESDRLLVQIQAYLDNLFDVGGLLEDVESKTNLVEHLEELQEQNTQVENTSPVQSFKPGFSGLVTCCSSAELQAAGGGEGGDGEGL